MSNNPYDAYLESAVMSADPLQLVRMAYAAAISAVSHARNRLEEGDIRGRSQSVSKAIEILAQLSHSLNHEAGGELSRNLVELYDYMSRRLIEANFKQIDEPMAEVLRLLTTVAEAWDAIANQAGETVLQTEALAAAADDTPPSWPPFEPAEPALTANEGWSF